MLFNSLEFALFLPVVFLIYWFVVNRNLKLQNSFLLIASYLFYGWWDWRFLSLLLVISTLNYLLGIRIERNEKAEVRRRWLISGLILNLGILGIFKYYNFFINSFIDLFSRLGYFLPESTTKIILPLGISFYTFLSISYIIDIYKKNLQADKNVINVLLTLSFFPIILAGPIQRPALLLPQINKSREFNYSQAVDGLKQILWGLFAKVAIADKLSKLVDETFTNFAGLPGSELLLGAFFFSVQIYADFAGYSNIAIGTAKLLGFNLMKNFNYPYFSRDISEFWKRWHISLTTWFRDYLFLPISFSLAGRIKNEKILFLKADLFIYIVASIVVWTLTGLWHGANNTFVLWGMFHGFLLIIYQWQRKPRKILFNRIGIRNDNIFIVTIETIFTLIMVLLAWVLFRADSFKDAFEYINGIFSGSLLTSPQEIPARILLLISVFLFIEWNGRQDQYAIARLGSNWRTSVRWAAYYAIAVTVFMMSGKDLQFIYFQF